MKSVNVAQASRCQARVVVKGFSLGMRRCGTFLAAVFAVACAASAVLLTPTLAVAENLPPPTGRVLLTIDGNIGKTTDGEQAKFDRAQLEAFGMRTLRTSNPFEKGVQLFEGVLFAKVLEAVAPKGTTLTALALDGYSAEIPLGDLAAYPVILAMKWNGKVMKVRNKGPLWVVYPVDDHPELKAESFSGRSIWQLTRITVK